MKCAKCKRKHSPKKLANEQKIVTCFIDGINATASAKILGVHYLTVKKRYDLFRHNIALYADAQYQQYSQHVREYDEYLYLPKSLKIKEKNMHKVQNFLTLCYNNSVYNLMMPTPKKYEYDLSSDIEQKKLSKFLTFNKIAKLQTMQNRITEFWEFFEKDITKYNGISSEMFIYYLKEAEFRFNYTKEEQAAIIQSLM